MQTEKILDKLELISGFPWCFRSSKDMDRVFDKFGTCILWLATTKQNDKRNGEFIADAPFLIIKLLEEIDQLKEQLSQSKKPCHANARKATKKTISRNS